MGAFSKGTFISILVVGHIPVEISLLLSYLSLILNIQAMRCF